MQRTTERLMALRNAVATFLEAAGGGFCLSCGGDGRHKNRLLTNLGITPTEPCPHCAGTGIAPAVRIGAEDIEALKRAYEAAGGR